MKDLQEFRLGTKGSIQAGLGAASDSVVLISPGSYAESVIRNDPAAAASLAIVPADRSW